MSSAARKSGCPTAPVVRSVALAVLVAATGAAHAAGPGPSSAPLPGPSVEPAPAPAAPGRLEVSPATPVQVEPSSAASAAAAPAPPGAGAGDELPLLAPAWLDVVANEVAKGTFLVHLSGADVWMAADDLERVGLVVTGGDRIEKAARSLVSLSSLAALLSFRVDEAALALRITARQPLLGRTRLDLARLSAPPGMQRRAGAPTAYLNWAVAGDTDEQRSASGELGVAVGPSLLLAGATADRENGAVRGLTTLYHDDDRRLVRWSAGDLVTSQADPLGGAVLVGGLSAGRYFALDPYLPLGPYPRTTIFSPTPATLEVWVDETLVRRQVLAPGTVDLENIPVNAGLSEIRTVLRDAFGREQSASTFALLGSTVLAPGLVDWSASAGFLREGFGRESFSYAAPPVGQARLRAGLTPVLTAGGRLEAADGLVSGGPSASVATRLGELEAAAAASRTRGESGAAATLGWRASSRRAGAVAQLRWSSPRYANLGLAPLGDRALLRGLLSGSLTITPRLALLGELRATRDRDAGDGLRGLLRLWWTHRRGVSASLSLSRAVNGSAPDVTEVLLTLSLAVPGRTTVEVSGATGSGRAAEYGQVAATRGLRPGPDVGYRFAARSGDGALAQADVQAQNRWARAEVFHQELDPWTGTRRSSSSAQLASGFVLVDGRLFPTRPIEGSFALVQAGAPGVTVLQDGQPAGRTDAAGELLVTNLVPNYANRLGIRDAELPLEYRVDEVERIIAPRERGGSVERFRVSRVSAVTGRLALVLDGREVAPELGEVAVELPGRRAASPVGDGGLFWLEVIPPGRHEALLRWEGRLCRFTFQVREDGPATLDLGVVRCDELL